MMYEKKKKKKGTSLILLFSFLKGAAYVFVVPESFARRLKIIMAISFTLSFLFVWGFRLRPLGSKREKNSFKILSILAIPALPLWVCDGQKPQGHGEDNEKRV